MAERLNEQVICIGKVSLTFKMSHLKLVYGKGDSLMSDDIVNLFPIKVTSSSNRASVGVNTFASMQLINHLLVAILAIAEISIQGIEGKSNGFQHCRTRVLYLLVPSHILVKSLGSRAVNGDFIWCLSFRIECRIQKYSPLEGVPGISN